MERFASPDEIERRLDALYERYGRPLEGEHRGAYAAISPHGETVIAKTMLEAAQAAAERFGPGSYLVKIGEQTVGHWRHCR